MAQAKIAIREGKKIEKTEVEVTEGQKWEAGSGRHYQIPTREEMIKSQDGRRPISGKRVLMRPVEGGPLTSFHKRAFNIPDRDLKLL